MSHTPVREAISQLQSEGFVVYTPHQGALIVVDPDAFCGAGRFPELVDRFCQSHMSSKPAKGFSEVVVPGLYDFRTREKRLAEGIPLDEKICEGIVAAAKEVGLRSSLP